LSRQFVNSVTDIFGITFDRMPNLILIFVNLIVIFHEISYGDCPTNCSDDITLDIFCNWLGGRV